MRRRLTPTTADNTCVKVKFSTAKLNIRANPASVLEVSLTSFVFPCSRVDANTDFLPPDAVRWSGICYGDVAVCLYVWLCVFHVDILCPNDWVDYRVTFTSCSPATLVFSPNKSNQIARGDPSHWERPTGRWVSTSRKIRLLIADGSVGPFIYIFINLTENTVA